jgi:pyruvate dehydrogenase E1 component alpha subunit
VLDLYKIGLSYEMPSKQVDGMNCETVHEAIADAAAHCRAGKGPVLLEMKTYRYRGHSMSDPAKYRTKEELEEYKAKDPIEQVLAVLKQNKWIDEKGIEEAEEKVKQVVEESVEFAENSPFPDAEELYKDVYVQEDYPYIMDGF